MNEGMPASLRRFARGMSVRQLSNEDYLQQQQGDREMKEWDNKEMKLVNESSFITTMLQCKTDKAACLCIHELASKFKNAGEAFDIGGTYNQNETPAFWFFGNVCFCHGGNYLLKLFIMTRNKDKFSLFLPKIGNNLHGCLEYNQKLGYYKITGPTQEYMFHHPNVDQIHHVKTFRFTKEDLNVLGQHSLLVPCSIDMHTKTRVHPDILNKVRFEYMVKANECFFKHRSEGKFIIESESGKQYPVHTFVAAAHSTLLLEAIKKDQNVFKLKLSDDCVETIIAFLYNGRAENVPKDDALTLLQLGKYMGITSMLRSGEIALSDNINTKNAVKLASVAESYNLRYLLMKVCHFIKQHPMVLYSKDIESLDDINLMRSILRYVANPCDCGRDKTS